MTACPIRYQRQVSDRKGKIFYTSITSLSHISKSCGNVVECNCVTGDYSMLIEVLFGTTQELDTFINHLQQFGRTRTQIVFSTPVEHRGLPVSEPEEEPAAET